MDTFVNAVVAKVTRGRASQRLSEAARAALAAAKAGEAPLVSPPEALPPLPHSAGDVAEAALGMGSTDGAHGSGSAADGLSEQAGAHPRPPQSRKSIGSIVMGAALKAQAAAVRAAEGTRRAPTAGQQAALAASTPPC